MVLEGKPAFLGGWRSEGLNQFVSRTVEVPALVKFLKTTNLANNPYVANYDDESRPATYHKDNQVRRLALGQLSYERFTGPLREFRKEYEAAKAEDQAAAKDQPEKPNA
jgi:hypothetical protein